MKINIISTGSGGNSILFCDSVLVDVGIPYKYLSEFASKIKIILLTHIHGDHFNKDAIRKLFIQNESIKFCCGGFLVQSLLDVGIPEKAIITIAIGNQYRAGSVIFSPVNLYHDTPNFGYRIIEGEHKHFHATDTFHLEGISAKNYDSATIECNHEINEAAKIIDQKRRDGEFCHLNRAIATHLSVDKAIKFMTDNNIKRLCPVHMGGLTANEVINRLNECKFEVKLIMGVKK